MENQLNWRYRWKDEEITMTMKTAVVTGSSSGFGFLTALELAKEGYTVLATMRNLTKGNALLKQAEENGLEDLIVLQELDVTSEESINRLKEVLLEMGRVDVLVNNAGFAGAGFIEEIPVSEYKAQFNTNVFGMISVTQAVLPLMRRQKSGTIINMSSISGRMGFPGLSPYAASKYAVEGWSECLRLEMNAFGVKVVLLEPGSFQTNIWSSGKQVTEMSQRPDSPYAAEMRKLKAYTESSAETYGDPLEIAKTIAAIVRKKNPRFRYPIGKGVKLTIWLKERVSWQLWETIVKKMLNKAVLK